MEFTNIINDPVHKKKLSIMIKTIMGLCVKFLFDKENQKNISALFNRSN